MRRPGPTTVLHRSIACPTCGAEATRPCMNSDGYSLWSSTHLDRRLLAEGKITPEQAVRRQRPTGMKRGPKPCADTLHFQSVRCPVCDVPPDTKCQGYRGGDGHRARRDLADALLLDRA